eukprot:4424-Pelagococcus_subviridis.AAC.1
MSAPFTDFAAVIAAGDWNPPSDAAAIARTRGCASVFASRRCRRAVAPMRPGAPTTSISASHASGSFHTSECRGGVQRRQKRS